MYRDLDIGEIVEMGDEYYCHFTEKWEVYTQKEIDDGVEMLENMQIRRKINEQAGKS